MRPRGAKWGYLSRDQAPIHVSGAPKKKEMQAAAERIACWMRCTRNDFSTERRTSGHLNDQNVDKGARSKQDAKPVVSYLELRETAEICALPEYSRVTARPQTPHVFAEELWGIAGRVRGSWGG